MEEEEEGGSARIPGTAAVIMEQTPRFPQLLHYYKKVDRRVGMTVALGVSSGVVVGLLRGRVLTYTLHHAILALCYGSALCPVDIALHQLFGDALPEVVRGGVAGVLVAPVYAGWLQRQSPVPLRAALLRLRVLVPSFALTSVLLNQTSAFFVERVEHSYLLWRLRWEDPVDRVSAFYRARYSAYVSGQVPEYRPLLPVSAAMKRWLIPMYTGPKPVHSEDFSLGERLLGKQYGPRTTHQDPEHAALYSPSAIARRAKTSTQASSLKTPNTGPLPTTSTSTSTAEEKSTSTSGNLPWILSYVNPVSWVSWALGLGK